MVLIQTLSLKICRTWFERPGLIWVSRSAWRRQASCRSCLGVRVRRRFSTAAIKTGAKSQSRLAVPAVRYYWKYFIHHKLTTVQKDIAGFAGADGSYG